MEFQRVKGMDEYYPDDYAVYKAIADTLEMNAVKFGFRQVSMPAIESIGLLTAKSGEEVKQQIFVLEKKGNEEPGLRFDLTVPMTRMFVAKQREMAKPVKWFSIAPMWRYEAPQKGRQREFTQLSVELFGSDKAEADAACLNLLISCMESFGLTSKDITIKINNRKLLEGLLLEVVTENKIAAVVHVIDKVKKLSPLEFEQELEKAGVPGEKIDAVKKITQLQATGKPTDWLDSLQKSIKVNELAAHGIKELKETLSLVNQDYITLDISIARGLAYYTGNVYECFDREAKYRSLAGGGRYDNLVELFGGEATAATGFAIGFATLSLLLADKGKLPTPATGPDYYIAPIGEKMLGKAMEIATSLRKKYSVDIDLMRRGLTKQFDYANTIKAKKIVIVGEKDLAEGQVTVRELSTGKEQKIPLNKL